MNANFPPIKERVVPERIKWAMQGVPVRVFTMGECSVLMSRDRVSVPKVYRDMRWHISVSCEKRDPTWEEIKYLQNALKPGVFFCMPMPPEEYWLSIHDHAYHVWEIKDENLIEQWKFDGIEAKKGAS